MIAQTAHASDGRLSRRRVAPFLLLAVSALLFGLWAGLGRIGWDLPEADGALMLRHAGLMVVGFVATVVAVERAVAVRSVAAFAAPAFSAAAGMALIAGAPDRAAPVLAIAAGAAYSVNMATLVWRHRQPALAMMLAGGVYLAGAALVWWDGGGYRAVVPWWMAFLALTISGERLEIIRFQRFSAAALLSGAGLLALLLAGPLVTLWDVESGARLLGAALLLGPAWVMQRDTSRRAVRSDGLTRFAAVGVLSAYGWMALTGGMLLAWRLEPGLHYDAVVHAFFIGFVFTAIMAHEPIIVPAVTGLAFKYTPALYLPLILLDGGLVVRVAADIGEWSEARRWAGMVQVIAVCAFLVLSVASVVLGRRGAAGTRRRIGAAGAAGVRGRT